ncbi:MAG: periplasmic heavy metal sensor [Acidobacteriota bacterium]
MTTPRIPSTQRLLKASAIALGVLALALTLIPGTSLFAQPSEGAFFDGQRGPGGGFGENLAEYLDLTEEQIAAVQQIRSDAQATSQPIREEQRALRDQLRDLLDSDAPDATTVGETVIAARALGEQLKGIAEGARSDMEALLTPEQLEAWETLQDIRGIFSDRGDRGPRGPGAQGPRARGPRGGGRG